MLHAHASCCHAPALDSCSSLRHVHTASSVYCMLYCMLVTSCRISKLSTVYIYRLQLRTTRSTVESTRLRRGGAAAYNAYAYCLFLEIGSWCGSIKLNRLWLK